MKNRSVVPANYDPHATQEPTVAREEVFVSQGFVNRRAFFLRLSESRSAPSRKVYVLRLIGSKQRIGPKYVVKVKVSVTPTAPYSS
jgi:hypothetical protein